MELLARWGLWRPNAAPFALRADWAILNSPRRVKVLVVFQSWPQAYKAPDFVILRKGRTGSSGARAGGNRDGILQYKVCRCTLKMSRKAKTQIPAWILLD